MLMQAKEALKNFTVAKISLPVHGNETVELDCVVHMKIPPILRLHSCRINFQPIAWTWKKTARFFTSSTAKAT